MTQNGGIREFFFGSSDSLLVSASVEDCVHALELMREPWELFSYEWTRVEIRWTGADAARVKVSRSGRRKAWVQWDGVLTRQEGDITLVEGRTRSGMDMLFMNLWFGFMFFVFLYLGVYWLSGVIAAIYFFARILVLDRRDELRNQVIQTLRASRRYGSKHEVKKFKHGVSDY